MMMTSMNFLIETRILISKTSIILIMKIARTIMTKKRRMTMEKRMMMRIIHQMEIF